MIKQLFIFFCFIFLTSFPLFARDTVDENELFGGENSIVQKVSNISITSNLDKEKTSLSGFIYQRSTYAMQRDWVLGKTTSGQNSFFSYIEGDIFLDIRLRKGFKAFIDLSAFYSPEGQMQPVTYSQLQLTNAKIRTNTVNYLQKVNTIVLFKELFLDYNINRSVYFRTGKQVVQWGQGYFWNPTDLINIDRKNFFYLNRSREGIFGNKIHIPFGTDINIYNFINFSDSTHAENTAFALKTEFLIGATEIALAGWGKKHYFPVYGLDFTSRLGPCDIYGEMSASYGDNKRKFKVEKKNIYIPFINSWMEVTNYSIYQKKKEWTPNVTLGFTKTFDWVTPGRITFTGEFFYNQSGYYNNPFKDQNSRDYFLANGLYTPNYNGVYYCALFITVNRVFVEDLSWIINNINNFSDKSYALSMGLDYTYVFNFNAGCLFTVFGGPPNTEYTYSGAGGTAEIYTSIRF